MLKSGLVFRSFAFLSGFTALVAADVQTSYARDMLTVAQRRDPQNLDPIDTFTLSWGSFGSNIFDGLLVRDENLKLEPALAKDWKFFDNNKRIRFFLREDVIFHNGEKFNAKAVKFTFDRLLGEQGAKGPQQSNYTSIERLDLVDDYTVDFIMNKVDPVLLTKLSGYGAMIVPPQYIQEVGEKAFDMKPVGTGPFQVMDYTPSVGLKMERFDKYWNGTAKVDQLNIRFISQPATRIAELLSGGVDIALNIPTTSIDTIKANEVTDLVAVEGPTIRLLRFKVQDAVTSDIRVRKAINMAIDRKAIIDALLKGYGSPITSAQGSKSLGFDPTLEGYPYDPEAAKKLLKEAGVKPGTEITLDITNNDDTMREVAQAVAGLLSVVGLQVKIRMHEPNIYSTEIIPQGKTGELFSFGWGGWTFDFDNTAYLLYHSGERWNPYIQNPELDKLLEKQRELYDPEQREAILKQIAAYANVYALDVPLFNFSTLYGVNKQVKGFVPAPDDRTRFMSVTFEK
ncbi:ABC transporter substrate-binding protein [Pseudovibrio sp. Ad26]|uniref:ABC transporter substrate-binding protein n=1 Tax=Pseudovibrio sp. Ad26 TaxID=989410 RepID=UPI0007AE8820|nr:ABC transporter substrate-binding protein [Pseudovibrio sp. Ad26]KZL03574.1 Heme-binding protein A precursor [Pseudovibrio sp. Ad26]